MQYVYDHGVQHSIVCCWFSQSFRCQFSVL
jgi:hypothetical protein